MIACPALATNGDASLSASLVALDCQVNAAVATGYSRLFGQDGRFVAVLTLVLTIYVAILALGLITGRTRLKMSAMAPRVLALGLVLTFATAWPAYQTVVYGLLTHGPDQIASAFMSSDSGATLAFAQRLDAMYGRFVDLAQALQSQGQSTPNLQIAIKLVWGSSLLLMLSTAGLLVVARLVLAVLLALGPLFMVFALFEGTRGLFEGWLKMAVAFALAPMLIVLGGAGVMATLAPMIDGMLDDPGAAVTGMQPVLLLFVSAVIYAATLLAMPLTAIGLTRGWRLHSRNEAGSHDAGGYARLEMGTWRSSVSQTTDIGSARREATGTTAANDRLAGLLGALQRGEQRIVDGAQPIQTTRARQDVPMPSVAPARRIAGLGQRHRAQQNKPGFSGRWQT